jgi:hypothetical protein
MNALRLIGQVLRSVAVTLAFGWVRDLADILGRLKVAARRLKATYKRPHGDLDDSGRPCDDFEHPAIHRPDPCIYSQEYLTSLGLAVTWDNPDIRLLRGGVQVPEYGLEPDTDYEVEATIWNNSYEAPAVGLPVSVSFLSFGVATVAQPVGQTFVNLGVKGGVGHPAVARVPWRTPPTPGHYCLQVRADWVDDANPANNMGQNNVDVAHPQSPALFRFRVRNATGDAARFLFEVDTYAIPPPPTCPPSLPAEGRLPLAARLPALRQLHDRSKFPVPPGWRVFVTPPELTLTVNAEDDVVVQIEPPVGFTGSQPFNVHARTGGRYVGGVSLTVTVP